MTRNARRALYGKEHTTAPGFTKRASRWMRRRHSMTHRHRTHLKRLHTTRNRERIPGMMQPKSTTVHTPGSQKVR
jgi:hypothetical protein